MSTPRRGLASLVILGLGAAAVTGQGVPDPSAPRSVRARVGVRLPGNAQIQDVRLRVAGTASPTVQDQAAPEPETLINIGWMRATEVDLRKEKSDIRHKGFSDARAVFYLHAEAEQVVSFELNPTFALIDGKLVGAGATPPFFVLEILELARIGDVSGRVLRRFDQVGFQLGRPNRFDLNLPVRPGASVGVGVRADQGLMAGHEIFIQVKASSKGLYPMSWKSALEAETEVRCHPDVRFTYVPGAGGSLVGEDPAVSLEDQIRRFLDGNRGRGDLEIPVDLEILYR